MTAPRKKTASPHDCLWESGELGMSEEHVRVATPEEMAEIDEALGLQMISIRLQKGLLEALKEIAKYHGIGYQPMIRDLLERWAVGEIKSILETRLKENEKRARAVAENAPLAGELRKRA